MNLYDLTEEWQALLSTASQEANEDTGEIAPDIAAQIDAIEAKREEKVDAIIRIIRNLNADALGYDAEIKRLKAKSAACDRAIENLRDWLAFNMQAGEKIKTPIASVSCREVSYVDIIGDVPPDERYGATKFTPSKTAIRKAIEAGENIAFAKITTTRGVVIR